MTDIHQEISEDYDLDDDEFVFDNELDQDVVDLNLMETQISQLCDSAIAVESFGINPTAFVILKATGLLAGTSLDVLATEHFRTHNSEAPETEMAMEALTDKIREKAAAWSAKVMTFTKSMSDKVLASLGAMWNNIVETGKGLTSKAWDKTKAAGKVVKAHPYKTVAAAVGAVAAVAAIVAFCASRMPGAYANESALKSFLYKLKEMVTGIKDPGGEWVVNVTDWEIGTAANPITLTHKTSDFVRKAADTSDKLGWTQTSVKALSGQTSQAWSSLKSGLTAISGKVLTTAKNINNMAGGEAADKLAASITKKSGSKLLGWAGGETLKKVYMGALWGVVGMLYMLLKDVVYKAFHMVASTFKSLTSNTQTATA